MHCVNLRSFTILNVYRVSKALDNYVVKGAVFSYYAHVCIF